MNERLAAELAALEVAWPPTPDIAGVVLARVDEPAPAPPPRRVRRRRLAPVLAWTAAALVAALGITMAASPSARSAILEWLGLKSVKIERKAPTATPQPRRGQLGEDLLLGNAVSLAETRREAGFRIRVPGALPPPAAVYYDPPPPPGRRVSVAPRPPPRRTPPP